MMIRVPDLDDAEADQEGDGERQDHLGHFHDQDHPPGGDAIGDHPSEESHHQARVEQAAAPTMPSIDSEWVFSKTIQLIAAPWSQVPIRLIP